MVQEDRICTICEQTGGYLQRCSSCSGLNGPVSKEPNSRSEDTWFHPLCAFLVGDLADLKNGHYIERESSHEDLYDFKASTWCTHCSSKMMDISKQTFLRRLFINFNRASAFRNDHKGLLASQTTAVDDFQLGAKKLATCDDAVVQQVEMLVEPIPNR